jgi:hypothetical protein
MGIEREIPAVRRRGIGWQAIVFLLTLAFALQSYLTQTHIHWTSQTSSRTCVSACVASSPHRSSPFGEAADCPFCQAIVHAGAFFAPAILAIVLPCLRVESPVPAMREFMLRTASVRHGQSRAPPLH